MEMVDQVVYRNIPRVKKDAKADEIISPPVQETTTVSPPTTTPQIAPVAPVSPTGLAPAQGAQVINGAVVNKSPETVDMSGVMKIVASLVKELIDVETSIKICEAELDNLRYESSTNMQQAYVVAPRIIKAMKALSEVRVDVQKAEESVAYVKRVLRGEADDVNPQVETAAPVVAAQTEEPAKDKETVKSMPIPERPISPLESLKSFINVPD